MLQQLLEEKNQYLGGNKLYWIPKKLVFLFTTNLNVIIFIDLVIYCSLIPLISPHP